MPAADRWPRLPYDAFAPTAHLLHMTLQAIGKLNLRKPFEPQWGNVPLHLGSRGLTTGLVPHQAGGFAVEADFVAHEVRCTTSWGATAGFTLRDASVAETTGALSRALRAVGVDGAVNPLPQEVPDPIPFHEDTRPRPYRRDLVEAWWRILVSVHGVMARFHAGFHGRSPPTAFMWGTFDLREVRFDGRPAPVAAGEGYIRRNAMDASQIEAGWWAGSAAYPRPAFYCFTWPQPPGIERASIRPAAARWDATLGEFLLDHDDLLAGGDPDADLLAFLESTYQAGAALAGWDPALVRAARPR
jgi:hypothetical protein